MYITIPLLGTAMEINIGADTNFICHLQDIVHAQEPRSSVHKRVTHSVVDTFERITFQVTASELREEI